MNQKPKRPPSVWISQIVLGVYILIIGAIFLIAMAFSNPYASGPPPIGFLFTLGFFAVFVAAFVGLTIRKVWGRWLTFGLLSLMFLGGLVGQINGFLGASGYANPTNSAQRGGYIMGGLLVMIPFAYLIYRLGFGDAANDFFNPPVDESGELFEPPPPPTFAE